MPSVGRPICSGHSSLDSLRKRQRPLHYQPCCTFAFEDLTHRASVMVREDVEGILMSTCWLRCDVFAWKEHRAERHARDL